MNTIFRCWALILLLLVAPGHDASGQSTGSGTLIVNVDTPIARVEARSAGRRFIRLPSLNYQFDIEVKCAPDFLPRTMSLSVADTRKSLSATDISGDSVTSINLSIPAPQIGPVAVENFCLSADDERASPGQDEPEENASLTLSSVLSMQASLLCANDTDSRMIYRSKSLDVTLVCESPAD